MKPKPDAHHALEVLAFETREDLARWLAKHHARSPGIWLKLAKKKAGVAALTYAEALEVALCWGWIDGRKQAHDADAWLQRFTPRGPRSGWSRINREKALALVERGEMRPAGQEEIDRARADGRWEAAYDSQRTATVPPDLQSALDASPRARAFFATLERRNRYAILYRVQTAAKAETRAKRIATFIGMLERGEKLHP